MRLKVVAADDEPLSLRRLVATLNSLPEIELIGSARDGREALDLIHAFNPDMVILDIEMPVLSGLDVAGLLLNRRQIPVIIFLTAYDRYAIRAFEMSAVDYLMKPLRVERLREAVGRAARVVANWADAQRAAALEKLLSELKSARDTPAKPRGIWIQRRGERFLVDAFDIDWIEAKGDYVEIHAGSWTYLHRQLLKDMIEALDPVSFLRIHRSIITRIEVIVAIRRTTYGGVSVVLKSGAVLPVGRTYAPMVRARLREQAIS